MTESGIPPPASRVGCPTAWYTTDHLGICSAWAHVGEATWRFFRERRFVRDLGGDRFLAGRGGVPQYHFWTDNDRRLGRRLSPAEVAAVTDLLRASSGRFRIPTPKTDVPFATRSPSEP